LVVLGIPLSMAFLFALLSAKELSVLVAVIVVIIVAVAYPALPAVMIRFYKRSDLGTILVDPDCSSHWFHRLPVPVPVVALLSASYLVFLHALILFNGMFPAGGSWATGLPGIALIDAAIVCLVPLVWDSLREQLWAWWGSLVYFATMTVLWTLTLATSTWSDILKAVDFPAFETDILFHVPLQGWHLSILAGFPLMLTVVAILRAKASYQGGRQ